MTEVGCCHDAIIFAIFLQQHLILLVATVTLRPGTGVYGLYFDKDGQVEEYKPLLTGTSK